MRKQKISERLFYILIFMLPVNLGYHFLISDAYVGGLLADYMIPTVYVQDILSLLILIFWIYEDYKTFFSALKRFKSLLLVLFVYAALLSVFYAARPIPSMYAFVRLFLYACLSLYISVNVNFHMIFKYIVRVFVFWAIFFGLLALGQYSGQGAVFKNYLFLGEQPYTVSTPGIAKENVLGVTKVPAYGIFNHPNIFGGFLAVTLLWLFAAYSSKQLSKRAFVISFGLGITGLFFTFSYLSWIGFILGMLVYIFGKKYPLRYFALLFVILLLGGFTAFTIVNNALFAESPSYYKRKELLFAGYHLSNQNKLLFGTGINNQLLFIEKFQKPVNYVRFLQPTHNVFVLILSEIGLVGLVLFVLLLFYSLSSAYKSYNLLLIVNIFQIVFLSGFDHYFFTIPQTFLLLWLILGFAQNFNSKLNL